VAGNRLQFDQDRLSFFAAAGARQSVPKFSEGYRTSPLNLDACDEVQERLIALALLQQHPAQRPMRVGKARVEFKRVPQAGDHAAPRAGLRRSDRR
jgi:hypothetical protein